MKQEYPRKTKGWGWLVHFNLRNPFAKPQVEKGCRGMFRKQSVQSDYNIAFMRQCCDMKLIWSNRKLGAKMSRTRDLLGSLAFVGVFCFF